MYPLPGGYPQRQILASKCQHPLQSTLLYTKGLSSLTSLSPLPPRQSQPGSLKAWTGDQSSNRQSPLHVLVNSHRYNPSHGEMQLLWVFWPRFGVTVDQHPRVQDTESGMPVMLNSFSYGCKAAKTDNKKHFWSAFLILTIPRVNLIFWGKVLILMCSIFTCEMLHISLCVAICVKMGCEMLHLCENCYIRTGPFGKNFKSYM
jgi:hypothetical protein